MRPSIRAAALFKGVGFSLPAFMAGQTDGFWYDFAKTDRQFQENVGPTPADDPNEVIGLALDQRSWNGQTLAQVLSAQTDLIANTWTDASTAPATFVFSSGVGTLTADGANRARARATISTVVGKTYCISATFGGLGCELAVGSTLGGNQNLAPVGLLTGSLAYFFVATATTTYIAITRLTAGVGTFSVATTKLVPGSPATQSSTSLKPKFQTTGAAFDGSDDYLSTPYAAGASDNFIVAKVKIPLASSGTRGIVGAAGGSTERFYLAMISGGILTAGAGTQNPGTFQMPGDMRGVETVVGLSASGGIARLFRQGQPSVEAAYTGGLATTLPLFIGGINTSGVSSSFSDATVKAVVAGREFIDLATFNKIAAAL
ncbi:hypothetical protein [Phenylobacterium sp.]|uniref:hypothetical protein n=1 Tax=Phenylobacterium sp. TaxID=1871053 RepID=UPI0030F371CD